MGPTTPTRSTRSRRFSTETKHALRTTEFWVLVVLGLAILIAAAATTADSNGVNDVFSADKAWLYLTILASAYLISRGLAKSGSYEVDDAAATAPGEGMAERVKSATAVLTGEAQVTPADGTAAAPGPAATEDNTQTIR